ncbi:MAG: TonB-dependent receptor plug domain-containing protein, partial [Acidobacteriota bacterium]
MPIVFALAVALVLAMSLPVGAEDAVASSSADDVAPDATSTPGAAGHVADEILVTARKREENVQDVPVAVTVLSGEVLEERAAADLSEIQADVPNLSISASRNQSGSRTTFLRGVGQAEPLWGVDPFDVEDVEQRTLSARDVDAIEIETDAGID